MVGNELEGQRGEWLDGELGGEAAEGGSGKPLGELDIADHVGDVGVGTVLGAGGGEVLLKLGDGHAVVGQGR